MVAVAQKAENGLYYALYDRNADGVLDTVDVTHSARELGLASTQRDREIAGMYNRFAYLQRQTVPTLPAIGYFAVPRSLAGHGVHWLDQQGAAATLFRLREPTADNADGLNVGKADGRVWAVFWGAPADPVFEGGATDFPDGEEWKSQRVVAFSDVPPTLTSQHDESWHTHGGLCITYEVVQGPDNSPTVQVVFSQFVTYNECQALPSAAPGEHVWINIWMLHAWLFDLNPSGFFGNTHPCIDPDAPSESSINGDREVPPFFAETHHG